MRYPKLVPQWVCNTKIKLEIETEGITEDGSPSSVLEVEAMGNFQDGGEVVYTTDQKEVKISGKAYFDGDIIPQINNIVSGYGYIYGDKREILRGYKRRNPDGSVNHVEIQFK